MLVEACTHKLLSEMRVTVGARGDTERFSVTADTATQEINKAAIMVASGQFTSSMALEYCKSISPKYHGQRLRPASVSNISPADIKLPWDRKQTVINTYEYVVTGVGIGPKLSEVHFLGVGLSYEERRLATMEKIEEVRQLIRSGLTVPQAGKVVGLKPSTIYLHLPGGAAALRAEDEIDLPNDDSNNSRHDDDAY